MTSGIQRDFVGYGANPPDPKWPGGARVALNFVVNYEEGSEASIDDGDGHTETALTEASTSAAGMKGRDLGGESMFEYGSRVGFWRLHRAFVDRGLPLTMFACALALERNPEAAAAIRDAGFDICGHGWRWVRHFALTPDEEREHIRKAVESFKRTVGQAPAGWYCRYAPSVDTRRLLVEHGGFLYDSDSYADELPYWRTVSGRPHLVVPYTITNNDTKFAHNVANGEQWFGFVRDAFDTLYQEGATRPKMMSIGLHMRIAGHPARFAGLRRFLDHVARHDGVWIASRVDIARHWIATHPYPGKGLNE
ncbi:MAG: allantoinase PuuE [Rhodospirillales bacterium]|nr:MAG: allantoinase PuuE [Rhodospirillales bacterium]